MLGSHFGNVKCHVVLGFHFGNPVVLLGIKGQGQFNSGSPVVGKQSEINGKWKVERIWGKPKKAKGT